MSIYLKHAKTRQTVPNGSMITEAAIGTIILLPATIIAIFVAMEISQAFLILQSMNEGAFLAAKGLANYYRNHREVVSSSTEQQSIFSQIRITNMINSNSQFGIPSGNAGWNTTGNPPTITVQVQYLSGQGSPALPQFPSIDPLNLGSSFTISGSSTCALVTN